MGGETCEQEVSRAIAGAVAAAAGLCRARRREILQRRQNARIVRAAEQYYRSMYRGSRESWNLRDRHMFDTLQTLMAHRPQRQSHRLGAQFPYRQCRGDSMGWEGEFNIGELCRTAYGEDMVAIGFGTDRGTVAAASDWDLPMEIKNVLPARPDSYEACFVTRGMSGR